MNVPVPHRKAASAPTAARPDTGLRALSAQEFRDAMSQLPTSVAVITTDGPGGRSGLTCSAVCAVSDTPPIVLACVHGSSAANRALKANGVLCVNSLHTGLCDLSQMFAGVRGVPMAERFDDRNWDTLVTGAPHYRDAQVALDCEVLEVRDIGTHSVFFAKVLAAAGNGMAEPLVHHRRAYATTRTI